MADTSHGATHRASSELVHLDVSAGLATITLDSPTNRNALSRQLVAELAAHLDAAATDPSVAVVLLRSSATVFCSGADMSEASTVGMQDAATVIVALQRTIVAMPKPVVVELLGAVRAGGIGIVAAADVVVAAEDATFALTEVKLGLAPAIISLTVLPRLTSRAAAYTCLTGEVFTGSEAVAMGLVTRAVPADGLTEEVRRVCASLGTGAAQGLRETKALLNAPLLADIDAKGPELSQLSARLFASDEAKAAMTAFLTRKR